MLVAALATGLLGGVIVVTAGNSWLLEAPEGGQVEEISESVNFWPAGALESNQTAEISEAENSRVVGDAEYGRIRAKSRTTTRLSLEELKILADPYRSPTYANLSTAEKELIVRHLNNPDFPLTIAVDPDTGLAVSASSE